MEMVKTANTIILVAGDLKAVVCRGSQHCDRSVQHFVHSVRRCVHFVLHVHSAPRPSSSSVPALGMFGDDPAYPLEYTTVL